MGKLLTSLPVLAFLSVLKACISCRDCVHIHTLLAFAFPLPHCLALACARNDVMVAVCICQSHLTCFMFVQAIVTREGSRGTTHILLPKGSVEALHKRPFFHAGYFRKHVRARGSFTLRSAWNRSLLKPQHGLERM